ncbi:hypothetical protein DB30_02934 [Enhygromyxa salina]|uniref:Uncharacterized protein n=2 Tax=Enhygromyxa salina TaxID=215803 RepID=A0A0C1ZJK3_9BACT|nr:hypothetical protein DB30_02934 [Enhygromyxa salina]
MFLLAAAPMGMGGCIVTSNDAPIEAGEMGESGESGDDGDGDGDGDPGNAYVCSSAYEAMFVCLSPLTCDEFMMQEPPGCEAEQADVEQVCFG